MRRTLFAFVVVTACGCVTVPVAPTIPVAADVTGGVPAVAAAPAKAGLFGRALKTPEQRALCRAQFGQSPLGQLVNGLLKPLDPLTGGIVKPIGGKDAVNPADLKKPAESAEGANARVKAEAKQAGAKIAAIEELAKVDCRRYPEVQAALIAALRAEKLPCVRLAAAKALLHGCCCTPAVVKALTTVVTCSDKDGNLSEDSEAVRLVAFAALERCLNTCQPTKPEEPPERPKPDGEVQKAGYTEMSTADIYADARRALAAGISLSPEAVRKASEPNNLKDMVIGSPVVNGPAVPQAAPPRADRGLVEVLADAMRR